MLYLLNQKYIAAISVACGAIGYQINYAQSQNAFDASLVGILVAIGFYIGIKLHPFLQKLEDALGAKIESIFGIFRHI